MNTLRKLQPDFQGINLDLASAQMSSRRTELSLHRTRMSADRTLMSIIRTALSLISFGFTIFQFFRYLKESAGVTQLRLAAAKNFGLALVVLGVGMLALGIWNHVQFMLKLRASRQELVDAGLVQEIDHFPLSTTLVTAAALLVIGFGALVEMIMRLGASK
jgi:putative membrane protein